MFRGMKFNYRPDQPGLGFRLIGDDAYKMARVDWTGTVEGSPSGSFNARLAILRSTRRVPRCATCSKTANAPSRKSRRRSLTPGSRCRPISGRGKISALFRSRPRADDPHRSNFQNRKRGDWINLPLIIQLI